MLDPIDGTRGFVGMRQYAVCLGLLDGGQVLTLWQSDNLYFGFEASTKDAVHLSLHFSHWHGRLRKEWDCRKRDGEYLWFFAFYLNSLESHEACNALASICIGTGCAEKCPQAIVTTHQESRTEMAHGHGSLRCRLVPYSGILKYAGMPESGQQQG